MKFCEAMDLLKTGSKVTRHPWQEGVYFKMIGDEVKSFQPKLTPYIYDEDIMVSDGWLIDENNNFSDQKEYKFCDIIPFLTRGYKVKLKEWNETFVYFDRDSKILVVNSMSIFPFIPDFSSFIAEDWIEL